MDSTPSCLLPNELILHKLDIENGSVYLTNRRLVVVSHKKVKDGEIVSAIPYDCLKNVSIQKERFVAFNALLLDEKGVITKQSRELRFNIPKTKIAEDKSSILERYRTIAESILQSIKDIQDSMNIATHNLSYLSDLPKILTQNAILDLNTVLQDQPIPDYLYHEAVKFLGDDAFLLEESLRDGENPEDGILFAAGVKGYILIRGKKSGRFMTDVLIDKVEWANIKALVYHWQNENSIMHMNYALQKGHRMKTVSYIWNPPCTKMNSSYRWLCEKNNGPWILADLMFKYSCNKLPASHIIGGHSKIRYYH